MRVYLHRRRGVGRAGTGPGGASPDQQAIAEGIALVTDRLSRGSIGAYQLQAAIAAVHDEAARAEYTDWPQMLAGHYRLDAVRAHLLEMGGDHDAAIADYRAAAGRTTSIPERNYLTIQAGRLSAERR